MMTAAAMLPREGRRWGDRDDNDGELEVVEVRWTTMKRLSRRREVAAGPCQSIEGRMQDEHLS